MCRAIFSFSNPFRLPSHSTLPFITRLRQSFLSAAPGSHVSLRHNGSLMQRNLPFHISSYTLHETNKIPPPSNTQSAVKVNSKNRQYGGSDRDLMRFGTVP